MVQMIGQLGGSSGPIPQKIRPPIKTTRLFIGDSITVGTSGIISYPAMMEGVQTNVAVSSTKTKDWIKNGPQEAPAGTPGTHWSAISGAGHHDEIWIMLGTNDALSDENFYTANLTDIVENTIADGIADRGFLFTTYPGPIASAQSPWTALKARYWPLVIALTESHPDIELAFNCHEHFNPNPVSLGGDLQDPDNNVHPTQDAQSTLANNLNFLHNFR